MVESHTGTRNHVRKDYGGDGPMLGSLVPVGGGDPIPLLKPQLMVGRRPSCDIRLEFANVSSHHCRLEYVNGYWRATDLSRNGTKVNGERIDEKFLQPGDTLTFAKHHFEIQYVPDPQGSPPVLEDVDPFAISLLEKAGLGGSERRDRSRDRSGTSSNSKNRPPNSSAQPNPKPGTQNNQAPTDDDRALEWLNE
jgi:pSer/pThr/pTyr-binding forkhead associated (FHA) protein